MLKKCNLCHLEKQLSDFRKDKTASSGYRYECKMCSRAKQQSTYTEKYGSVYRDKNKEKRAERFALVRTYRMEHPCICCGEDEPAVLDFHHLDPSKKDFQVSGSHHRPWPVVLEEIEKCVVLCSNCHKKVHAGLISLI